VTVCVAVGTRDYFDERQIGAVVSTTNGGASWEREPVPSSIVDLEAVACRTRSLCEAVGTGRSSAVIGTADGGSDWVPQGIPRSVSLTAVACPAVRTCETVGSSAGGGLTYRTADGGTTWTRHRP
jgi:photosystem II stability/assembly factor-like uncharacterized protein